MASLFSKSKDKKLSQSPNDGQKAVKLRRLKSPEKEISDLEQEGDIIGSLHIIMEEIQELKAGQSKITADITKLIDKKINDLRTELKGEINTRIDHSEMYFRNECILLNQTVENLTAKIEAQATEIAQLKSAVPKSNTDPLDNTDLTVIVSGLPAYPGEDPTMVAEGIVENLGTDQTNVSVKNQVKILKAARLPTRNFTRPPLLKISFSSLQEKKWVLSNKSNLLQGPLRKVFMRSSKSHEERLMELNTKIILENCPWGKDYRMAGSGRIVPKSIDNNNRDTQLYESAVRSMEFLPTSKHVHSSAIVNIPNMVSKEVNIAGAESNAVENGLSGMLMETGAPIPNDRNPPLSVAVTTTPQDQF